MQILKNLRGFPGRATSTASIPCCLWWTSGCGTLFEGSDGNVIWNAGIPCSLFFTKACNRACEGLGKDNLALNSSQLIVAFGFWYRKARNRFLSTLFSKNWERALPVDVTDQPGTTTDASWCGKHVHATNFQSQKRLTSWREWHCSIIYIYIRRTLHGCQGRIEEVEREVDEVGTVVKRKGKTESNGGRRGFLYPWQRCT